MAKRAYVWDGSNWTLLAVASLDIDEFITAATASATYLRQDTASATYLPISASANLGGGGYSKSFLLGGM